MYHIIIVAMSIFSVFYLDNTGICCAVVYQCYKYSSMWTLLLENDALTNDWCEHMCEAESEDYHYSGTISNRCFCRADNPRWIDHTQKFKCTQDFNCPGNSNDICGGEFTPHGSDQITVSKIERISEAVTVQIIQASSAFATSISLRDTTTTDVNGVVISETSSATVMTETSTPARTEQTTKAVTVHNTLATSATSIYIRDTTTEDDNGMLTSETFPAITTQSTPFIVKDISSSTSENVKSAILSVKTETSTPARTVKRSKKLLCECPKKFCNTKWHFLDGLEIRDSDVMKIVLEDFYQNILSEITIDKKYVTKEVRKRNSAVNKTKSAKFIGTGCIVFLILPMVIVIAIDLLKCCSHFRTRSYRKKHVKRNRISAIPGDIEIPLQENVPSTDDYYASRCGNNFHPDEFKRETYVRRRKDPC